MHPRHASSTARLIARCTLLADHDDLHNQILAPLGLTRLPLARGECLCATGAP